MHKDMHFAEIKSSTMLKFTPHELRNERSENIAEAQKQESQRRALTQRHKTWKISLLSAYFLVFLSPLSFAQTLDFKISADSIYSGESVLLINRSSAWPSGTKFIWDFVDFYPSDHNFPAQSLLDTTYSIVDTVTQIFFVPRIQEIVLIAVDSNGMRVDSTSRQLKVKTRDICETILESCSSLPDGSFEVLDPGYTWTDWETGALLNKSCTWGHANDPNGCATSTDYFYHNCGNSQVDIPNNWVGGQPLMNPSNESGYAGTFCMAESTTGPGPEFREYIAESVYDCYGGELYEGRKYIVGMYVSLAGKSRYASNIGIWLGDDNIFQRYYGTSQQVFFDSYFYASPNNSQLFNLAPQVKTTQPITDTTNWVLVQDTIVASNQTKIIIGNFDTDANSSFPLVNSEAYFCQPTPPGYLNHFYGSYYYVDHVFITPLHKLQHDTICLGGCLQLTSSVTDPFWSQGNWDWSNDPLVNDSTITVCPQHDTLITCTVSDLCGCTIIDSFYIKVNYPPQAPIILGNRNNCDLYTTYQVSNPQPNADYYWGISNSAYSNDFPTQGQQINVQWNQLWDLMDPAGFVWMYILSIDTTTQCYRLDSVKIWNCCVYENNAHVNDMVISDNSIFTGNQLVLNGTITVNNNITVPAGDDILMGPEAKIVVNPPYTFTINTRTVKAGCRFMWDGIYVSDSNAKVVIQANSTVQDAYNAVNSSNGGKFELYNSNFVINRMGVFVHDYFMPPAIPPLSRHKGIIKGCSFTTDGTGMIAPFLYQKPTFGVFADNVNLLTIGDSTSGNFTNNFSGLFCGIASFNSKLGVYNNTFTDIKPASPVVTDPADFISVQTETAIHSVGSTDNILQANPSSLNCGGSATNLFSGNTFTNDQNGIYTYKTLSKLNNNVFTQATSWAIFLRDFKHQSYVNSNTIQNGSGWGIRVLNTVPNSSTGIKMMISNNRINDPNSGIFVSNVTSSSSNSNYQTQLINNTIYLNGSTTLNRYGIRLQNSDNIIAYCNKVKRSTLVPVADSLRLKGIQLENCAGAYLHDNTFSKLSLGIKTSGIIGSTPFANANYKTNNLDSCYHAFYFATDYDGNTTVLSNQGALLSPTDNKFYNHPSKPYDTYRFGGALSTGSYNWYYKTGTLYNISIPIGHKLYNRIVPISTTGTASIIRCGEVMSLSMTQQSLEMSSLASAATQDQVLSMVVNDNASFGEITSEMKYGMEDYAFKLLTGLEQTISSATQSALQQYNAQFSNLKQRNIARFHEVKLLIDSGRMEEAKTLNRSLSPENQIEINRQFAYNTYLQYVVPQADLPHAVLDQLQQLADTHPVIGGEGVYIARAILGYQEPVEISVKSASNVLKEDQVILVFPNPANDAVSVLIEGFDAGLPVTFKLYNLLGKVIITKQLITGEEEIKIDIHELPSGYYLLTLNSPAQTIYKDRLVIVR